METLTKQRTVKTKKTTVKKAAKPTKSTIVSKPVAKKAVKEKAAEPAKTRPKTAVKVPVRSYRDLATWQLARDLSVAVYRQVELFPQPAASVLACQMTQASVQVCASVAESFNRRGYERDQAFTKAHDALVRLENYMTIAQELGFLNKGQRDDLARRGSSTYWAMVNLEKINREWSERHDK